MGRSPCHPSLRRGGRRGRCANGDGFTQHLAFAGLAPDFNVRAAEGESSRFTAGVSIGTAIGENATASASDDGAFADNLDAHGFSARPGLAF